MNALTEQAAAVLLAVVGVALAAVLVSRNSNTAGVLKASGSAFSSILGAAVSPVAGSGGSPAGSFGAMGSNYGMSGAWPQFS